MVRTHPDPPQAANAEAMHPWGCSSVGRAPALQAGGHRFDPVHLHQELLSKSGRWLGFDNGFYREGCWIFNNQEEVKVFDSGNGVGHWVVIANSLISSFEPAMESRQARVVPVALPGGSQGSTL